MIGQAANAEPGQDAEGCVEAPYNAFCLWDIGAEGKANSETQGGIGGDVELDGVER